MLLRAESVWRASALYIRRHVWPATMSTETPVEHPSPAVTDEAKPAAAKSAEPNMTNILEHIKNLETYLALFIFLDFRSMCNQIPPFLL